MQRFFLRMWYSIFAVCFVLLLIAPAAALVGAVVQRVVNRQTVLPDIATTNRDTFVSVDTLPAADVLAPSTQQRPTLVSGAAHTCLVTYTGRVLCWGDNQTGKLGYGIDGAALPIGYTANTVGALHNVTMLAAGAQHTCALVGVDASVWCWGANDALQLGQLAAGPMTESAAAQRISSLTNITAIAAGAAHACALRADGTVWCWGANTHGQTGTGAISATARVVQSVLPEPATALYAGGDTTCALLASGVTDCWGAQIPGLGADTAVPTQIELPAYHTIAISTTQICLAGATGGVQCWSHAAPTGTVVPVDAGVTLLRSLGDGSVCALSPGQTQCWQAGGTPQSDAVAGVVDISGGTEFRCVAVRAGRVRCRGRNTEGQLALRTATATDDYVNVRLGSSTTLLSAGTAHVCGLWQLGSLRCWGRSYEGQLGVADTLGLRSRAEPVTPAITAVDAVATGANHTCALRIDGTVSCWGANEAGQLGLGDTLDHGIPLRVAGLTDAAFISAGSAHTCVLSRNGAVWCWGDNDAGQLGAGPLAATSPRRVTDVAPLVAIASGGDTNCGLQADGLVVCWGRQIGDLAAYTPFAALTDTTAVAVAETAVCAVRVDGTVWCWGDLDGSGAVLQPHQITGLPPIQQLSAGQHHACAIDTEQRLWCWGGNRLGQVDPADTAASITTPVQRGSYIAAVTAGASMTCARSVEGTTSCWGTNTYSQLGTEDPDQTTAVVSGYDDGFAIAAGGNFSCALLKYVAVRCWGSNEYGQLGDGTTTAAALPQTVRSNEEAVSIATGSAHACQIITDGTVRCWGHNNFGQLGNETTEDSSTPVVAAVQAAVALSLGQSHSCALLQDGGGACWGKNDDGQLGSGNTASSGMPLRVADLRDAIALSSGGNHTCAVHQSGTVSCWGRNEQGQLGIGSISPGVSTPTTVPGLTDVTTLSAGTDHTCALRSNSTVWCWGWNHFGQTSSTIIGEKAFTMVPLQVPDLTDAVAVQAGGNHTCALRRSGTVRCWGDNYNGQLGVEQRADSTVDPHGQDVRGLESVIQIATGGAHTCVLLQRGNVHCWGWNRDGQLGTGSQTLRADIDHPTAVVGQQGIHSLAIGNGHICDIDAVGTVWCWGANDTGQLGIGVMGDAGNYGLPSEVDAAVDSLAVELGAQHSCALLETAELNCWGHNQNGQLGNAFAGEIADSVVPNFVIGMQGVTAFGAGGDTSCAVSAGIVSCWGDNQYAQLGTATVGVGDFRMSATVVDGIDSVSDITVGADHVCALRTDQTVWCWGRNNVHQIDGSSAELVVHPAKIPLSNPISAINAASDHTCALDTAGAVWCWGNNQSGQLSVIGENIRTIQSVKDIPPMQQLTTGGQHTCALSRTGQIWCWGSNEHGQLGIPKTEQLTNIPPTALTLPISIQSVVAGADRTCAIATDATVWCWGENSAGTLGISPNPDRHTPAIVTQLWTMRVGQLTVLERTPLPTVATRVPTNTPVPTATPVPTRTLIRTGARP